MRSLNLDQVRALIEVVNSGNFTVASRRLHLTQPAISLQIRELEARCGLPLVERVGKRAVATPAGRDLIVRGRRIIEEADQAIAAVRRHRDGAAGRVHIGTGPTALAYLLPPILRRLRQEHPGISLVVTTNNTQGIVERIQANIIDLGFTALPVDERLFDVTVVRTDTMVAILPADDRDIPGLITPADVVGRPLILEYQRVARGRLSRGWLEAAGVEPRPAMEFDSIEAMKSAVSGGLGMAIVPETALANIGPANNIAVRPLDPPLIRTLGLVQRRNRPDTPALTIVRRALLTLRPGPGEV